ncbi:erythrocyte membrane protein 1, PfEMP1, putative [Plasmodium sp. gorilla clade G1]|nr:erythrocyte membrane protein 1, PfEMP1, putative [Plasmodium sp. gorilla clade G1]
MAPASGGRGARDVLDEIGGTIQEQAQNAAKKYSSELRGDLKEARFPTRRGYEKPKSESCKLNYVFDTNVTNGKSDPCLNRSPIRFSDTEGAKCYSYAIRDNDSTIGFCAPYRRLHLCVQNLEQIDPGKIKSTHNLLVDVLLAAKYEGESLVEKYKKHKKNYPHSNICTILARSFADIGDIIRGKDLYLDHETGKQHLEERLEQMFKNIMQNNGEISKRSVEEVREYWWALNRDQVWKAITCGAEQEDTYSKTTQNGRTILFDYKCGHHKDNNVPTNLDYVPQHLRWFEEWAEGFCRKRNNTLKLAKKECRGEGNTKYCSLNGYDCTKAIEKGKGCSRESDCTSCSNKCVDYDFWLGNQRDEFKIQKGKYENEIETYVNKNGISNSNINTEYYKKFYHELKNNNKNHEDFLKLLNKGRYCKTQNKEDAIDFTITGDKDAFHRSDYCQPCPDCVVECDGRKCEEKKGKNCRSKIIQKILKSEEITPIKVLINGNGQGVITENLHDFCSTPTNDNDKNYKTLKCYNKNNDYNNCEMISSLYKDPNDSNAMLSVECFHSWARNLLIDTIKWEHQLKNCINNTNVTDCTSKCIKNCECYEKWIKQKGSEWKEVKGVIKNKDKTSHNYYDKLKDVFDRFLDPVRGKLDQDEKGKWDQFREELNQKIGSSETNTRTGNSQDAIEFLLDHLKDNATTCKDNNSLLPCTFPPEPKPNPCIRNPNNSNKPTKTVKQIAEMMQQDARKQLEKGAGETKLKADATRGTYGQGGPADGFKDVCSITDIHSNRTKGFSRGPCTGKDNEKDRFKIGTEWKTGKEVEMTDTTAYIPPRRQHMCTSNLEFLETDDYPLNSSNGKLVNNSFLGDVLLSAKMDAEKIIDLYKEHNEKEELTDTKYQETVCRAIKYSFADIGDIIRGKDLWNHKDQTRMQGYLKNVFDKIKEYHPGIRSHPKYAYDKNKKPPYKQLREDWWEANRHQVWRAMKCAIEKENNMKCNGIPIEDYIPQKLRWMTELAEWYCKFESKLNKECKRCVIMGNPAVIKCNKGTAECKKYKELKSWKEQWKKLGTQYSTLYTKARVNAFNVRPDYFKFSVEDKDKAVYDFLLYLYLQNGGKLGSFVINEVVDSESASTSIDTPYDNAGAYVHDMVNLSDYSEQVNFCDRGKTLRDTPLADVVIDEEEAAPEKETEEKPVDCTTVDKMLQGKKEKDSIGSCNEKTDRKWDCNDSSFDENNKGACMPPRRISLCLYFLAGRNIRDQIDTQEKLREAFIKCAAAETFLSWQYYKTKNGNDVETQLKAGNIPPEFLRSMFYTYGDYRDIFFDTDISKKKNYVLNAKENIDQIFPKKKDQALDEKRKSWWTKHGPEVWNGMLCALSYDTKNQKMDSELQKTLTTNPKYTYSTVTFTSGGNNSPTLETFAQRPQFLRWFTEWGEHFCKEHKVEKAKLVAECPEDTCTKGQESKEKCKNACETYKKWLKDWKDQYEKQSKKYFQKKKEYKENLSVKDDVNASTHAYNYLQKALTKLCPNGTCSVCMDEESKSTLKQQNQASSDKTETYNSSMPASLDEEPDEVKDRCNCKSTQPPPEVPQQTPLSCVEIVAEKLRKEAEEKVKNIDKKLKGDGTKFKRDCNKVKKLKGGSGDDCEFKNTYETSVKSLKETCKSKGKERFNIGKEWKCVKIYKIGKDLCLPPRREHMCLDNFKTLLRSNINDSTDLLIKFQEVANSEGDDIIKNLLAQNPCKENVICDAMKYSFADLGDIIRGRDLLTNSSNQRIQTKLKNVFIKIYSKLESSKRKKYENDIRNLYELRSDWWDANREHIWKAMTCNAPDNAKLNKRSEEPDGIPTSEIYVSTLQNCGYGKKPPDYDYIPQPFRWMQEWSEYYCKFLNEEIKKFETQCEDCKNHGITCEGDKNGKKCEKCKEQCENYKKLFDKWKLQFNKYKETYNEIYNNKAKISSEDYVKNFLNELKNKCEEQKTADKYLDETSHCKKYKFTNHSDKKSNDNYAFENPPKEFEQACECEEPDPLDQCPHTVESKLTCTKLSITSECWKKYYNNDLDSWDSTNVKDFTGNNNGVLVPPRRKNLCLRNITSNLSALQTKKDFKKKLMEAAFNEAYLLSEKYKDQEKAFSAMKYSYYDYGDIVKGTDLISTINLIDLNGKLNDIFKTDDTNDVRNNRDKWWNENKRRVWHAMICGYQKSNDYEPLNASWCTLPTEDNNTSQFLRWFREWTESFCIQRKKLYDVMVNNCKEAQCDKTTGKVDLSKCTTACREYENYVSKKKNEYFSLKKKYDKDFKNLYNKDAPDYFKFEFYLNNYDCLYDHFKDENNWINPYQSLKNDELKGKCNCTENIIEIKKEDKDIHPKHDEKPKPPVPDIRPAPPSLPPADEPFDPTILQTTIPFGVALALGSIAFLFMKKKTQSPVDLFSVINIPKGDYNIPTLKSSNRYIPYASDRYKGKTYIYMEGDSSGDEKYSFMSDTTDVTSSESEYEELDINDIYAPGSPKYKTLIEVVLEPSKRDIPSDDIPTNKFTDEEWNQLKHDFISNMLQNQPNDVPNDYKSGKVPLNTQPNTLYFDNNQEKPFITSIHDRNLYSGEEYNYNVNMVNSMDDIPLSGKNDVYSGIDLINDSLNNNNVDIYDEVLKRKENELFGTNHPKHTNKHNVTKSSNSDPIDNQLDLFHTWLDRHRDMCEQWNNKEELLDKLKEEWNKDNNGGDIHTSDNNKTLNTDVSIQIHMDNPKPINQFTNMDTILDDLEKYNEPYYDVQDDIYYDVNDHDASTVDSNAMDVPSKVQIEMDVNTKLVKEKYPIADVWDI